MCVGGRGPKSASIKFRPWLKNYVQPKGRPSNVRLDISIAILVMVSGRDE